MTTLALPPGWRREEIKRTNGLSGKIDVYYISPKGRRIKSKIELAKYLGPNVDLSAFDFRTGKINPLLYRKDNKPTSGLGDLKSLKYDTSLTSPARQVLPLGKKRVVLVKSQPDSVVYGPERLKELRKKFPTLNENAEKPYQLFWQKRLEGVRPHYLEQSESDLGDMFELPTEMRAFSALLSQKDTLMRSVAAALQLNSNHAVRGQEKNVLARGRKDPFLDENCQRNPVAFVNPNQPLIQPITISEEDIRRQEEVVRKARLNLQAAIADL